MEEHHWRHRSMRELEVADRESARARRAAPQRRLRHWRSSASCSIAVRRPPSRRRCESAEAIQLAHRRVPEADLAVTSVTDQPLGDGGFDPAALKEVLQHAPEEDVAAAFGELRRVVRTGSPVVLISPRQSRTAAALAKALLRGKRLALARTGSAIPCGHTLLALGTSR
jgi:hypothetical protein